MAKERLANNHDMDACRHISWSAIITGALIAIGLGFLFNVLNGALGLSAFTTNQQGITTLAVGGASWLIICAYFSMFIPGYVTGRMVYGFVTKRSIGMLYGFVMWSLALFFMLILASHVSLLIAFASQAVSPDISTPAKPLQQATVNTKNLGMVTLMVFFIFFVGAISSCLGAMVGLHKNWRK